MVSKKSQPPMLVEKSLSGKEAQAGIAKLRRRIEDLEGLLRDKTPFNSGKVDSVESNIKAAVAEIFGEQSIRYAEIKDRPIVHHYAFWNCEDWESQEIFEAAIPDAIARLEGLITWLEERLEDPTVDTPSNDTVDIWDLMHPKIMKVAYKRFSDGHFADAVETALKAVNVRLKTHVKSVRNEERDGASLMQFAFSVNNPVVALGDISTETGRNMQQGYMQIFSGAMIGIRNPKAHDIIDIDENRALHFLMLASLLMCKLDEAAVPQ